VKIVTDVSYPYIESVQQHLDIGVDGRHFDQYCGIYFAVFDRKICTSAINFDFTRASLDQPISMLWTDDPTYAEYLVSTFELLWEQAAPAAQHIEELLKAGSPQT
jgi:hypothetical protein